MSDDPFLSRWARRKAQAKAGVVLEEAPAVQAPEPTAPVTAPPQVVGPAQAPPETQADAPPPPTMDDVAALTHESDYSRFVAPQVDESVKRAALKKLFTDPHFNVMDRLDTYIDDYSQPDPIPESMLRRMAQSKFLGLFDHEEAQAPKATPDGEPATSVRQSVTDTEAVPPDEDPDLRLQQDDAAGPGGTRGCPPA